jgi:hypothetical protein
MTAVHETVVAHLTRPDHALQKNVVVREQGTVEYLLGLHR